jgi:polyisoprenoid-binding protein YceI
MMLRAFAALLAALAITAAAPADSLKFNNTASKIEFVGKKKDGSHNGGFKKFAGTIDISGGDFSKAKVAVEIQTESIFTDNDKLTGHLKSPDFFDVRTHPKAKFTSTIIRPIAGDEGWSHLMTGELTLHGVTKTVAIPVRVQKTETGLSLSGKVTIQRKDFGMTYGEGMVNNDVAVTLTVQAGK